MKTLTLDEALKNAPPKIRFSPDAKSLETSGGSVTIAQMNPCGSLTTEENEVNAALLAHAYNHMREMRDALEEMIEECERNYTRGSYNQRQAIDKSRAILAQANTVTLPE